MLEYGFATECSSAEIRAKTKRWCAGFTDTEMQIFHQVIPFMCMSSGIGKLYDETIIVLVQRIGITDPKWINELCSVLGLDTSKPQESMVQWMKEKLIGYYTNCGFDTHREWLSRHVRALPKIDADAPDDKVRFTARSEYITKVTAKLVTQWQRGFDEARRCRLDATVPEVEVVIPVAV